MSLLGIDIAITGAKVLLIEEDGSVSDSVTKGYETRTPKPLWSEQEPTDWWNATCLADRAGVVLRIGDEERPKGLAAVVDRKSGEVCCGAVSPIGYNSLEFQIYDSCCWDVPEIVSLRVLDRDQFAAVYVDDRLALCVSLLEKPRAGAAGCFVEGGRCIFEEFRIAELEPLPAL